MKTIASQFSSSQFILINLSALIASVHLHAAEPAREDLGRSHKPPPGYKTNDEVKAALFSGQIKPITPVTSTPEGVIEETGIQYGTGGGRPLLLDLARPKDASQPVPALIFIHGGAWRSGSRDVYRYYTVRYAQRGYVAVTISYRLSQEAPFPAALEDAKCAVRWLRANAATYHVDPNRIAAIGGSAGGHLAMMLGYSSGVKQFEGNGGNPETSSAVQAVINLYGPYDLTTPFAQRSGAVKQFLSGKSFEEAPDLYAQASPQTYLRRGAPPTLILHGTIDDTVPIEQADALAARLKELEVPCTYERLEGWPHAMDIAEVVNEYCQGAMNAFLEKHLPLPKSSP